MKEMCRIALLLLLGTAAFAQTDVPPAVTPLAEKPPAEVDQALRARVNEFYTMMKPKAGSPTIPKITTMRAQNRISARSNC
jgi:hypothetical protein